METNQQNCGLGDGKNHLTGKNLIGRNISYLKYSGLNHLSYKF